jgi:hypothetical protein
MVSASKRYEVDICTAVLCLPEALLSFNMLYLWIQPVAVSMKHFIFLFKYAVMITHEFLPVQCRGLVVAVFVQCRGGVPYNTAMDDLSKPSLLPISLSLAISERTVRSYRSSNWCATVVIGGHHASKREEYGYQWRDFHDAAKFPFTPGRKRCQKR